MCLVCEEGYGFEIDSTGKKTGKCQLCGSHCSNCQTNSKVCSICEDGYVSY